MSNIFDEIFSAADDLVSANVMLFAILDDEHSKEHQNENDDIDELDEDNDFILEDD